MISTVLSSISYSLLSVAEANKELLRSLAVLPVIQGYLLEALCTIRKKLQQPSFIISIGLYSSPTSPSRKVGELSPGIRLGATTVLAKYNERFLVK